MADNEFGYTRWGMDWVRLAEPLRVTKPEPLLPRARSVARSTAIRTEVEGSTVRAHIHRGSQASVTYFEIAPLSRTTISAIAALIPATSVQLSDEDHATLIAAGITLAPTLAAIDCSCPARNERCLHMLATCYDLARRVDENPRLALDLQGYRSPTAPEDSPAGVPPARWTPLDTLDPATYFEPLV
ncbi:SWIM zinc finger family protein [Nocardia jejuensis]|uniref:SWIM zinc finger family protein n=1 Tax=Nocardia jejuensis TaxID=328049 RepID=UPI00082EA51C|nr:SWIM zinc finger family protein [Nocardia jejuensis]